MSMPEYVVFAGNPGAGKSTLLNSLIGSAVFESGLSCCGLTTVLSTHTVGGTTYCDTPGLDDPEETMRQQAADSLVEGLRLGGKFRLVFIVTLRGGRVKAADIFTVNTILAAISPSVNVRPALVINKAEPGMVEKYQPANVEAWGELLLMLNTNRTERLFLEQDVFFHPLCNELAGQFNALLAPLDAFRSFVEQRDPAYIAAENVRDIQLRNYDQEVGAIAKTKLDIKYVQRMRQKCEEAEQQLLSEQEERKRALDAERLRLEDEAQKRKRYEQELETLKLELEKFRREAEQQAERERALEAERIRLEVEQRRFEAEQQAERERALAAERLRLEVEQRRFEAEQQVQREAEAQRQRHELEMEKLKLESAKLQHEADRDRLKAAKEAAEANEKAAQALKQNLEQSDRVLKEMSEHVTQLQQQVNVGQHRVLDAIRSKSFFGAFVGSIVETLIEGVWQFAPVVLRVAWKLLR